MRRGDADGHADGGRHQRGRDHQRQGLERGLPVPLIHDEEERGDDECSERQGAPQPPAQGGGAQDQERRGNRAQQRRKSVDAAADDGGDAIEQHPAMGLHVLDHDRDAVADRNLMIAHPALEAEPNAELAGAAHGRERRTTVEGGHPLEPAGHYGGVRLEPALRGHLRWLMAIENVGHYPAFLLRGEGEVAEQPADVGALRRVAGARVGVNPRLAVVWSEDRVSAGQVAQIEAHVHRVRVPGEKHDGRVGAEGALDLRQHALLARLDQFEIAQAEEVLPQHPQHQAVAVVPRLDAVDRVVELRGVSLDVCEAAQAGLIGVGGCGEGVLGPGQVGAYDFD